MNKPNVPDYLNNITVVLARTSHPSNIGSAARAMKTMGLTKLVLVAPHLMNTPMTPNAPIFDENQLDQYELPEECFVLASGAKDVLEKAQIVTKLDDALEDVVISCALTSRKRELSAPLQTPRELAPEILKSAALNHKVALVFGNETFGLSIEEVNACNRLMTINGNPHYFSLNLAQAVQVVTYELFSHTHVSMDYLQTEIKQATHRQVHGMVEHMQLVMNDVGFFENRNEDRLMRRVTALFDRANLSTEDVDILRGFCSTVLKKIPES